MKLKLKIFQAKVGREKEFRAALQKLRGKNADITREATAMAIQVLSFPLIYIPFPLIDINIGASYSTNNMGADYFFFYLTDTFKAQ